ncbi:MAG: hypothetical protein P8N09_00365 [Planctomycetota bacterium]|nr:hypothetical protein [Planctomycetota bacterium]
MISTPKVLVALLLGAAVVLAATENHRWRDTDDGPVLNSVRVDRIDRRVATQPGRPGQLLHRRLTLHGRGFGQNPDRARMGPQVSFRYQDGRNVPSPLVEWHSDHRVIAWVPEICRGTVLVELRNPDGQRTTLIADL